MKALLLLYLIDILPNSTRFPSIIIVISGLIWLLIYIVQFDGDFSSTTKQEVFKPIVKKAKVVCIIGIILFCIFSLFPSKQTMYLMAGTYLLEETQISQKAMIIINEELDKELKLIKQEEVGHE